MTGSRRSIRLKGYDYTREGAYYVTVCANGKCIFGDVNNGKMVLNVYGNIIKQCWSAIPEHFSNIKLDEYVVMPDHIHGIIMIGGCGDQLSNDGVDDACRGTACRAPTSDGSAPTSDGSRNEKIERFGKPVSGSLSTVMRSFKSAVTKRINEIQNTSGTCLWQRNYYEHIIRDGSDLARIREYIMNNPVKWGEVGERHAVSLLAPSKEKHI